MLSGGGLVEGVDRGGGHLDRSLEEQHVQTFVVLRTEGRVHYHCVKLVVPFVSNTVNVSVDDINVVDFKV